APATRGTTSSLWLQDLGSTWCRAKGTHLHKALRRRSPPMMKLCWPTTCGGTPARRTVRARSMRPAVPGQTAREITLAPQEILTGETIDEDVNPKFPDLVLRPAAHAVAFNGSCKCRLPEGLCEFRSQGLSCAESQRHVSYELAYLRHPPSSS